MITRRSYAGLKDYQYSASLYDIAGASPRVSKPAGEWNSLEIQCVGLHVTVVHNGVRVVDASPERFPLLALRNQARVSRTAKPQRSRAVS